MVVLLLTRPETLEIVNLAVVKEYRQQGIGTYLINYSLEWARNKQVKVVEVGTGSTSFNQLYLYQKCGFRVIGIDSDFFVKHYEKPLFENGLQLRDMLRLHQYL
ncbi:GNAT family N-acetyltransferase [Liquorilactobacillus oeni]|uniref:N-acetyltransferase domain-containing protein n=1 Tax=Liquorilactobacillus oeni DSM 19972 TaxID=1423777 RepID=A0A0R1MH95_9LACO|nr:GNAT family N-acetyltransferase [Liquorilactobacillus oeni]KRL04458.1 hypothetical protein FD46_GL001588 [Liquorilactobacillus oeni DSM 19972]